MSLGDFIIFELLQLDNNYNNCDQTIDYTLYYSDLELTCIFLRVLEVLIIFCVSCIIEPRS